MAIGNLWKALTTQISQASNNTSRVGDVNSSQTTLESRVNQFGRTVVDTKDWTLLKKKIMDLFFEYAEQKTANTNYSQHVVYQQFSPPFQQSRHQMLPDTLPNSSYAQQISCLTPNASQSQNFDCSSPSNSSNFSDIVIRKRVFFSYGYDPNDELFLKIRHGKEIFF